MEGALTRNEAESAGKYSGLAGGESQVSEPKEKRSSISRPLPAAQGSAAAPIKAVCSQRREACTMVHRWGVVVGWWKRWW